MPGKAINRVGQRFGLLTVTDRAAGRPGARHAHWECRCDCGATVVVRSNGLTSGRTVSCGCLRADPAIRRAARLTVPAKRRRKIARDAAAARWEIKARGS